MGSNSLTKDWTWAPLHWENGVFATGPPGKSLMWSLYFSVFAYMLILSRKFCLHLSDSNKVSFCFFTYLVWVSAIHQHESATGIHMSLHSWPSFSPPSRSYPTPSQDRNELFLVHNPWTYPRWKTPVQNPPWKWAEQSWDGQWAGGKKSHSQVGKHH